MKVILVVDDEYALVEALELLLVEEGYTVLTAPDGKAGLEVLRAAAAPPDLCLCDVMMPVMGGLELVETMRRDPVLARVPVILMSAAPRAAEAARVGANAFLRKPFDLKRLLKVLQDVVASVPTRG